VLFKHKTAGQAGFKSALVNSGQGNMMQSRKNYVIGVAYLQLIIFLVVETSSLISEHFLTDFVTLKIKPTQFLDIFIEVIYTYMYS
jgi:hypothetical protein